ncbi:6-hydroxymethylpterin diphosphokinase MptE-like protein [Sulfurospirillum diekertiae]|uniref:Motility accessory factor n=1 Tax=Sulfurospirillum diekertiae TaxID=1854492 RepID=A0A1Y0HPN4_9BACT|nr:6-hydroxymethylpterin diphosphokinase MptE-like protein [Sulfurospirillum diekertiae]ARU50051.1 hypothetical protein Sdiek1_2909 [Sulfurospirillum diekertiae]ASC94839.1 hypothetical protein Sdiek2_2843 [Sulfurospirillum diekertiae]
MHSIEAVALKTFQENLTYFEKNHKPLYEKLLILNQLIDGGLYKEHYALEYKEEGYFDILEINSNEWLYGENSIEYSKRIVDNLNLKRTGGVFKAHKYIYATEEQADYIDKSELSFHNSLWATIKIINYAQAYNGSETYMSRVHKVIFLDLGLGLHLDGVLTKLNPQVAFIQEKNLELFRLSLFVTNYKNLAQNRFVYFSIADDELSEKTTFLQFLDKGNNYNLTMKHIPFNLNYEPSLRRLQGYVLSQSYISYGYSAMLLRFIDSPHYLSQNYSFLNVNKMHSNNLLSEKPILLLFSGPSTLKNIEWVKANRHHFIVVSALSTCRLLQHNNISPDVVVHIDPGADATASLFEGIDVKEYFKNSIVLLASNVDETTVQEFERSKIHFIEQGTLYKKGFGRLSAPSVGEYSYGLFLVFGAKKIFLLGIDLALDSETLQTHGGFHVDQTQGKIDEKNASLDPSASVEYVRGNFLDQVPVLSPYKISHMQFEAFTDILKDATTSVYNLSNGAYLKGAEPLHVENYNWEQFAILDQSEIHHNLGQFFNSIGEAEFNEADKRQIKYQVSEAKKLEKIIKQFQKKKFAHVEAFLNTLSQLSWDLSDMDYKRNSDLAQVYYEYFPIILSYIFDLFNTKDLANPHKHMVQINAILVKQLLKISTLYISKLEGYVK